MLSMEDVIEQSGLSLHTFQSWRRNGLRLLPNPIAVEKRKIFFPDSILERIRYIREQQSSGKTLAQIEEMILEQEANSLPPSWEVMAADSENFHEEVEALRRKWEAGDCQAEICQALKLDPALSGQPTTFCLPAIEKPAGKLMVYVSIISNSVVHFAELEVDLYDEPAVVQTAEIPAADYGMMLCIIAQEFSDRRKIVKTEIIPYLLFHGLEGTGATGGYWMQSIEVAGILNQITQASRQYLIRLRDSDIKIP